MEGVVIGALVLFGMWMLSRLMSKKIESQQEARSLSTMDRSPEGVARMLMADIRRSAINQDLMNRLPPKAKALFLQESFLALASAQMLAIDQTVLRLDSRGPLMGSFRKQCPAEFVERYDAYKRDFSQHKDISNTFAGFLGLVDHEKIAVNLEPFNKQFLALHTSSSHQLRRLGLAG